MDHSSELVRCLAQCDVVGIRKLWAHVSPHLPQPENDHDALVSIHHARTLAKTLAFKLRAYSHRWLTDNGYPSGMPDELKPKAERMYPKIVSAVGISVNTSSPLMRPYVKMIEKAMSDAVAECYADGKTDPVFVSARMEEARIKASKGL